uniref:Spastin/Vps4 C-terminal domain-containing protein n=1 Tax=Timema genevievae TaxID=629358 RepID=A0A7R9JQX6_TIMGE|nr:unnamed protein product [Timema genevievae]
MLMRRTIANRGVTQKEDQSDGDDSSGVSETSEKKLASRSNKMRLATEHLEGEPSPAFPVTEVTEEKGWPTQEDASMMSMRRKIAGLRPDQIRQLPKEELDLPVSVQDFDEALDKCNKSVSREDLNKYEKWMKEFGST